eukprot:6433941-Alexandrium_andersonii.AAC.1
MRGGALSPSGRPRKGAKMALSKQTRRGPPAPFPGLEPKWPRGRPERAQGRANSSRTYSK